MPKFRKKPVVIEAEQLSTYPFEAENPVEAALRLEDEEARLRGFVGDLSGWRWKGGASPGLVIPTLEGQHLASPGDWIIKGVAGEFYPCKPDIFAKTYEPAEDA